MLMGKRGAEIASESEISPSPATGLTSVYNDAAIRHEVHLPDMLEVQSCDCQISFSSIEGLRKVDAQKRIVVGSLASTCHVPVMEVEVVFVQWKRGVPIVTEHTYTVDGTSYPTGGMTTRQNVRRGRHRERSKWA